MEEAARFGPLVLAPGLLLEAPDQRHAREQLVTGRGVGEARHGTHHRSLAPITQGLRGGGRLDRVLEPVVAPEDLLADPHRGDAEDARPSAAASVAARRPSLTIEVFTADSSARGWSSQAAAAISTFSGTVRSLPAANCWRKAARLKETVRPVCLAKVATRIAFSISPGQGSGQTIGGIP